MKPHPFRYLRAESTEHATKVMGQYGDEAKILAGGQSLVPLLNLRLARPAVLVDISGLTELGQLDRQGQVLTCGPLVTHHTFEQADLPELAGFGALSQAASLIGHLPIRTRGTLGGSLAHADSTAEWPLVTQALDAVLTVRGPDGERQIPAHEFFLGLFTTAMQPDEILTGVRFPRPPRATAVTEYARRAGDFAVVAVAADLVLKSGRCQRARVVLGGVAGRPVRIPRAEEILAELVLSRPSDAAPAIRETAAVCAAEISPPSDTHGSAAYRRRLTHTLVERALASCVVAGLGDGSASRDI